MLQLLPQEKELQLEEGIILQNMSLEKEELPPAIIQLLQQFEDLFQDRKVLPLSRGFYDHRIPLKADAKLVNIRPYRYPLKQKDIIE